MLDRLSGIDSGFKNLLDAKASRPSFLKKNYCIIDTVFDAVFDGFLHAVLSF